MLVKGKKSLNPGLLIIMSPGSRPNGIRPSHGHSIPAARIIAPVIISSLRTPVLHKALFCLQPHNR